MLFIKEQGQARPSAAPSGKLRPSEAEPITFRFRTMAWPPRRPTPLVSKKHRRGEHGSTKIIGISLDELKQPLKAAAPGSDTAVVVSLIFGEVNTVCACHDEKEDKYTCLVKIAHL